MQHQMMCIAINLQVECLRQAEGINYHSYLQILYIKPYPIFIIVAYFSKFVFHFLKLSLLHLWQLYPVLWKKLLTYNSFHLHEASSSFG